MSRGEEERERETAGVPRRGGGESAGVPGWDMRAGSEVRGPRT